ncbi:MAG: DUF547 domain-containing protein [Planctomycetota bacterium]|jgi:hypothetical protein
MASLAVTAAAARDVSVPADAEFARQWNKTDLGETHALWTAAVSDHVDEAGLVDYDAIRSDRRFREYLYRLGHTDPGVLPGDAHKLAFWLNAYNALAIQGVLETLPVDTARWPAYSVLAVKVDGKGFFEGLQFLVGGRRYGLDEIEKAVLLHDPARIGKATDAYLRVGPRTPDPRIHFALVCCARGCPPLQRWAYRGEALDEQLTDVTRKFAADPARCRFNADRKVLSVSQLLEWYHRDLVNERFEPHAESVTKFLARYVSDSKLTSSLENDRWRIEYLPYDWALNLKR